MSDYQNAGAIALYDAQVIIETTHTQHPFHEFKFGVVKTDGFELNRFAMAVGLELVPLEENLEDLEFEIFEPKVYNYGTDFDSCEIVKIEARIDGPQMLSLKIHEQWPEDLIIREIAYCGRYSIEWSIQENT